MISVYVWYPAYIVKRTQFPDAMGPTAALAEAQRTHHSTGCNVDFPIIGQDGQPNPALRAVAVPGEPTFHLEHPEWAEEAAMDDITFFVEANDR